MVVVLSKHLHAPVVLQPGTSETFSLELGKRSLLLVNTYLNTTNNVVCLSLPFLAEQFQASLSFTVSSSALLTRHFECMSFNSKFRGAQERK
jgi:hypothetical protein